MFKPVGSEIVTLNNYEKFFVAFGANYISIKNGKGKSWLKVQLGPWGNRKSSNNQRFIKTKGNSYYLPDFKKSEISGYQYGRIHWLWRCRNCLNELPQKMLDSNELCPKCNHP